MAQTKPLPTKSDHHPVMAALHGREQWEPRAFTRMVSRVSPGTRAVAAQVSTLDLAWREITAASLESDLPLWVVLGDSTAQGVGATSLARGWVARVAGALAREGRPHAIVNLSRSGARSNHVRHRQLPLLDHLHQEPALITCGVGSNDIMRNPNPPSVSARVNELIDELPPATIICTLPAPALNPPGRWVNRSVQRTAARRGIAVADVVPHLVGPRRGLAADRFHPSDRGYDAWVEAYRIALGINSASIPDEWDPREFAA